MNSFSSWIPAVLIVGFFIFRFFRFRNIKKHLPELIKNGAVIIDVRSEAEFQTASNPKSINVPLNRLGGAALPYKKDTPLVLCCASGARSGMGVGILKSIGFKSVFNAGPWTNTL
jgi:rhodanese-related sulfurtransferase